MQNFARLGFEVSRLLLIGCAGSKELDLWVPEFRGILPHLGEANYVGTSPGSGGRCGRYLSCGHHVAMA